MAFVELETWQAAPQPRTPAPSLVPPGALVHWLVVNGRDRHLRRIAATTISLLIHAAFIWFLIHRLGDGLGSGQGTGEGSGALSVIDLMSPRSAESAATGVGQTAVPPPPVTESEVDSSIPTDLPKPEWSVSRVRVERPPAPMQAASPSSSTARVGQGSAGGAAFGGGGSGYDPYAGAAPLRREQASSFPSVAKPGLGEKLLGMIGLGSATAALELDPAALEAVRQAALRAVPTARGTAEFIVSVSPTGMVLDAQMAGGNADPRAIAALRAAMLGRKLFDVKADIVETREIRLPMLRLG